MITSGKVKRTIPYKNYISPTDSLISETSGRLGFKGTLSLDLVRDLANYMSFPDSEKKECFTLPSSWNIISDEVDLGQQQAEISFEHRYHKRIQEFIDNLEYEGFSGSTPLEQAINIVAALSSRQGGECRGGSSSEPQIPIFQDSKDIKKLCKELKETVETMEKIKPGEFIEKALNIQSNEGLLGGVQAANLGSHAVDILNKIGIFRANGKIAATKKVSVTEDPYSNKKQMLMMKNYSEISKVSPIQHLLPSFEYKFATKQFTVEKGVDIKEAKQCLVLLIDDSGSMSNYHKISWLKALLLNRCEEVINGNAELFICTFEVRLDQHWLAIRTEEEAKNVWDKFRTYFQLGRGGTNMQSAIQKATELIKSGEVPTREGQVKIQSIRPQIVIINDGQDDVDVKWVPTIETHGFILEGRHTGMKQFCERSGGSYTEFWNDRA